MGFGASPTWICESTSTPRASARSIAKSRSACVSSLPATPAAASSGWAWSRPGSTADPYADSGRVIRAFSREEFADFVALAEEPGAFDLERASRYEFGDETDHPLSRRADALSEVPPRRLFPVEGLLPPPRERSLGGQALAAPARASAARRAQRLPARRSRFIAALPFAEIGRARALRAGAERPRAAHRDSEPGAALAVAQSISFVPARQQALLPAATQATSRVDRGRARLLVQRHGLPRRRARPVLPLLDPRRRRVRALRFVERLQQAQRR